MTSLRFLTLVSLTVLGGTSLVAQPAVQGTPGMEAKAPGRTVRVGAFYEPAGPHSGRLPEGSGPIVLKPGPQLFLDDYLIDESRNVTRTPITLRRDPTIPNPLVTGARPNGQGDRNFQPWVSCFRDPDTGRFRFWYDIGLGVSESALGYLESADGIRWERPVRQLAQPDDINFGASVIDEGKGFRPASERYKLVFNAREGNGLELWASPDGLSWSFFASGPRPTADIVNLTRDTARRWYLLTFGMPAGPPDGYVGTSRTGGTRRLVGQSISLDGKIWTPPRRIIMPEDREGMTEFYGMGGLLNRGETMIGTVKVLRDDLPCDPGGPLEGTGYTTVAWTHDGLNWLRERLPLLDRDHTRGAWDHAHAWVDDQLLVGDDLYLYYCGYKSGHKVNRFEERQLGLVKMKRDRYVAREAGVEPGFLRTPLVVLEAARMTLNLEPFAGGEIRVQVMDASGRPIPGLSFADCRPLTIDAVAGPVIWGRTLAALRGRPVRLEFSLKNVRLYGFGLD